MTTRIRTESFKKKFLLYRVRRTTHIRISPQLNCGERRLGMNCDSRVQRKYFPKKSQTYEKEYYYFFREDNGGCSIFTCDVIKTIPVYLTAELLLGVGPAGSDSLYADTVARLQKSPPYYLQCEQIHVKSVCSN